MFATVLIANRGEIAVRITRTLHRLGIRAVVTAVADDAGGRAAAAADLAVGVGSYLSVEGVIDAALASGAEAVHPGYGFLAENPALARACAENGLVFIGPPPARSPRWGTRSPPSAWSARRACRWCRAARRPG